MLVIQDQLVPHQHVLESLPIIILFVLDLELVSQRIHVAVLQGVLETNVNTMFAMERIQMIQLFVVHVEHVLPQTIVFAILVTLEMIVKLQHALDYLDLLLVLEWMELVLLQIHATVLQDMLETNVNTMFAMEIIQMIQLFVVEEEFVKILILVFATMVTLEMIVKLQHVLDYLDLLLVLD
jgi:chromate transport protein ChrA